MNNAFQAIQNRSQLEFLFLRAKIILTEQSFLAPGIVKKMRATYFPKWLQVLYLLRCNISLQFTQLHAGVGAT